MLKTLRNRLIVSHILPLLIIIPMTGIGLIFMLETQIYLPAITREVENDAWLIARLAALQQSVWQDPLLAQDLLSHQPRFNNGQVMLLDSHGKLVAASSLEEQAQIGQVIAPELANLDSIQPDEAIRQTHYSPPETGDVIEVTVPVFNQAGALLGFVWIRYPFASFIQEVYQVRFLIILLLALGLLFGSGIGYLLAVSVATPIREVTTAISTLAGNARMNLLNVNGPEEIQLLAQSVNNLVVRLRELEQTRRQLLANLVHELGRPLGALRSAITALDQGAEKDPALYHDLLTGMDDETGRLQRLLNDLAGLSEYVLGTLEIDRQPINLNSWLPDSLRTWQAAAQEKHLHWQMDLQADLPVIYGDPNRLAQIIGNLASNAVKFTPPGGQIKLTTLRAGAEIGIAIADTGPGISSEEQERIFQPFYRGGHGKRFPQGMGLGLSIAREMAEAHGGHLEVESHPGGGTRFVLWLPLNPPGT